MACGKDDPGFEPEFGLAPENPNIQTLTNLINNARTNGSNCDGQNLGPMAQVTYNQTLEFAAKAHSQDLSNNLDQLVHTGSDNSTPTDRVESAGYILTASGVVVENIAKGYATEESVFHVWMESTGHCENIMDERVTEFGVGTSGAYWTLVLARQ